MARTIATNTRADREAAVLLRHPDLLEPVAAMHRDDLFYLLGVDSLRQPA